MLPSILSGHARDRAGGVSGLNVNGNVIAPGAHVTLTRDGSGDVYISERTSDESPFRMHRVGVADFDAAINNSGAFKDLMHENNHAQHGTYTGDGTAAMTVAHGLGRVPHCVWIFNADGAHFMILDSLIAFVEGGADYRNAATAPDATNFTVGIVTVPERAANENAVSYNYVVI